MPVHSGLNSYGYKTTSYRIFSHSRSLLVVHSIKYFHNNIYIFFKASFRTSFQGFKKFCFFSSRLRNLLIRHAVILYFIK